MKMVGSQFAPVVIDVYGDMIAGNRGAFDKTASELRLIA
jgi:hypothetical protein